MNLLKRQNWWIWLLAFWLSDGILPPFILGLELNCYDANAWYSKWQNWVLAILCFFFPVVIMLAIFYVQSLTLVANKLKVPQASLYTSPLYWLVCLIVPFVGWALMGLTILYLIIYIIVNLARGFGELTN